tara:strand:+ start:100 stop:417 length:318 start_codon:yes stop_codon:yes gene_type:complete
LPAKVFDKEREHRDIDRRRRERSMSSDSSLSSSSSSSDDGDDCAKVLLGNMLVRNRQEDLDRANELQRRNQILEDDALKVSFIECKKMKKRKKKKKKKKRNRDSK